MKLIKTEKEYRKALARVENLMSANTESELDELELWGLIVEKYEDEHYPITDANPIEVIKFKMEQQGLKNKDIEQYIGSRGRVSEVLNGKRGLSLAMIKSLHKGLKIPYAALIS
ncbi:MAG: transcriptional regulator [SAR86 cluster bacterium]|uniref:Transcriptional regulator n=1 Tax=SAR86 cluster bacterium TaxID=2030880 RepID=A0A2A5CGX1_9GAMM|nr:helix-turn-helix domain-containing protein [Gammaproteobacteria bacterium AH-315-E17]PCJ42636.1 MAG: transcriptional regulator [SAR86 cluster bacterium]